MLNSLIANVLVVQVTAMLVAFAGVTVDGGDAGRPAQSVNEAAERRLPRPIRPAGLWEGMLLDAPALAMSAGAAVPPSAARPHKPPKKARPPVQSPPRNRLRQTRSALRHDHRGFFKA